jgi:hypothetical protein
MPKVDASRLVGALCAAGDYSASLVEALWPHIGADARAILAEAVLVDVSTYCPDCRAFHDDEKMFLETGEETWRRVSKYLATHDAACLHRILPTDRRERLNAIEALRSNDHRAAGRSSPALTMFTLPQRTWAHGHGEFSDIVACKRLLQTVCTRPPLAARSCVDSSGLPRPRPVCDGVAPWSFAFTSTSITSPR